MIEDEKPMEYFKERLEAQYLMGLISYNLGEYSSAYNSFDIVYENSKRILGKEHKRSLDYLQKKAMCLELMGVYNRSYEI